LKHESHVGLSSKYGADLCWFDEDLLLFQLLIIHRGFNRRLTVSSGRLTTRQHHTEAIVNVVRPKHSVLRFLSKFI